MLCNSSNFKFDQSEKYFRPIRDRENQLILEKVFLSNLVENLTLGINRNLLFPVYLWLIQPKFDIFDRPIRIEEK